MQLNEITQYISIGIFYFVTKHYIDFFNLFCFALIKSENLSLERSFPLATKCKYLASSLCVFGFLTQCFRHSMNIFLNKSTDKSVHFLLLHNVLVGDCFKLRFLLLSLAIIIYHCQLNLWRLKLCMLLLQWTHFYSRCYLTVHVTFQWALVYRRCYFTEYVTIQ